MKTNKIIFTIFAGLSLLSAQSCLKDQADIFDESSSARLINYVENTKNILTGAKNGWIMEYYPGIDQKLGGYVYYLKFNEKEVEARFELKPEVVETSVYKFTFDNSAVLSFDSNNNLLHRFATPSSSKYEAMGGDFEFSIMEVSPERIRLLGKRSGNHCDLVPLEEGVDPALYMKKLLDNSKNMRVAFVNGKIGGKDVSGEVDLNKRRITFEVPKDAQDVADDTTEEEGEADTTEKIIMPFTFTPDGIKAYDPIQIGGCTLQKFYYLAENNILSNGSSYFNCSLPENYVEYEDFVGSYKLHYNGRTVAVELKPNEDHDGFVMYGLNSSKYTVNIEYDKSFGRLNWCSQRVGENGNNAIYLLAWTAKDGYITYAEGTGVYIYLNLKSNRFEFEDNGVWEDFKTDSFMLYELSPEMEFVDQCTIWGNPQYAYLDWLEKVN